MNNMILFQAKHLTLAQARDLLQRGAEQGLRQRLGSLPLQYQQRLDQELSQITEQEALLQQFVTLWDVAQYAREHGILTGTGDFALAGSMTAFGLGLSLVDPVAYGLPKKRLLAAWEKDPRGFRMAVPARAMRYVLPDYLYLAYQVQADKVLYEDDTLSRIDYVLRAVEARTGSRPSLPDRVLPDPEVFDFMAADGPLTFCLFRQGSPILRELRPRNLQELADAGAFQVREMRRGEGPDPLYQTYLERKQGPSDLQPQETRGCILYREQAVRLLRQMTGCTGEQASQRIAQLQSMVGCGQADEPSALMLAPEDGPQCLLVSGGELQAVPVSPQELLQAQPAEGNGAGVLWGLVRYTVSESRFLSSAMLSWWAAYVGHAYPEEYQQASLAFPGL